MFSEILSWENQVFRAYVTYSALLVLKMMLMAPLTIRQRFRCSVMASAEDLKYYAGHKMKKSHEDVDRIRRAHLNDLENIPIFFLAAFVYTLTNPEPRLALNLFRAFTVCRCVHTFVYGVFVTPQPARGLSWIIGYFITAYMAVAAILHFRTF